MNILKTIISGVILYAIIFLVASTFLFLADTIIFNVIIWAVIIIAMFVLSNYYYFKEKAKPMEAFLYGLIVAIISFLIEIPVMVYGFAADQGWNYLMSWELLVGYLLIIIIPILVAMKK